MTIKIPKLRIMRDQHRQLVTDEIIMSYLKVAFWISPFGFWKLYELIRSVL